MEAALFSETSVSIYKTTQYLKPKDLTLNSIYFFASEVQVYSSQLIHWH
jgi:hypothetical protein